MLCQRSENVAAPLPKRDAWGLRKWKWDIYEIKLWEVAEGRRVILNVVNYNMCCEICPFE